MYNIWNIEGREKMKRKRNPFFTRHSECEKKRPLRYIFMKTTDFPFLHGRNKWMAVSFHVK